jgi:thiamine-phosphate pyrophosphorylase
MVMMVTDRRRFGGSLDRLADAIGRAARAGVDAVQIREPGLDDRTLVDFVTRIVASVPLPVRTLVNGRADIALAAGAAGVHLRSDCVPASRVRAIVPRDFLIGRSIHSPAEAMAAEEDGGCDYLMFGTVFPSSSKPFGHPVAGVGLLSDVCSAVSLPVVAIGGIDGARAADAARAGARGVAGIEMFAEADEPALAAAIARMRGAFE